jgi:hypothetical protein
VVQGRGPRGALAAEGDRASGRPHGVPDLAVIICHFEHLRKQSPTRDAPALVGAYSPAVVSLTRFLWLFAFLR